MSRKSFVVPARKVTFAELNPAQPLPVTGGAYVLDAGALVRDPAEPAPENAPSTPPSTEA
jgi:hypothetical protein